MQDVTYFSRSALYDAFKRWRDGGVPCAGAFNAAGAWKPALTTRPTRYDQGKKPITSVEAVCRTRVFPGNRWGMEWFPNPIAHAGDFPEYFRKDGDTWTPIPPGDAPPETGLIAQKFRVAKKGATYITPTTAAWKTPGPTTATTTVTLVDGSHVTYAWYRFIDQPVFQQYHLDEARKQRLQKLVTEIHARWTINRQYMPPPSGGSLVRLDPALIVTPPAGMETGYVPIVVGQRAHE